MAEVYRSEMDVDISVPITYLDIRRPL